MPVLAGRIRPCAPRRATEDPAENTGAAYEVHTHTSTKQVTKDFKGIKTETRTGHDHRWTRRRLRVVQRPRRRSRSSRRAATSAASRAADLFPVLAG
jgi:hypothetical protein